MKRLINIVYVSLLLAGMLASCATDDFSSDIKNSGNIVLQLFTENTHVGSRATINGESNRNENLISTVDVFIFNQEDGRRIHYQRIENLQLEGNGDITLSLAKERVSSGTYNVYVIANYVGESLADVQSVNDLKTKSLTTEFNFVNGTIEDSFLMDGKLENVSLAGDIPQKVELYRAAAKIQVNIQTGETNADGNSYQLLGGSQKRIINYATTSKLLAEGNEVTNKNLKSMNNYLGFTGSKVLFYTYANSWAFDPESSQVDLNDETYILLNLPMKEVNSAGELIKEYESNYYRVSLNRSTGEQTLERNHFYEITVIVNAPGSSTEVTPVSLEGTLEVQEWHSVDINVGTDDAKFLEVNKEYIYLANIDANESTDNSLMFYSSSVITNIQVSDVKYTDKYGVVRSFTKNDTDYPDGETYYPTVEWKHDETTGAVTIHSKDLINVPKTFTLTITNADGLTKKVYVEQYPLEYITSTQGWHSYREDFGSSWLKRGEKDATGGYRAEAYGFGSKVVRSVNTSTNKSVIYKMTWDSGDSNAGQPNYTLDSWPSGRNPYFRSEQGTDNARMYHVHITAASSTYRLGYPILDSEGNTADTEDNESLVSPSFMIASQLGNVNPMSKEEAKRQCNQYVEVTNVEFNGTNIDYANQKTYDDWRLPTKAEIEIIDRFQKTENSAVSDILTGRYYWTATDAYKANDEEPSGSSQVSTPDNARIRCVRDVKPEETGN